MATTGNHSRQNSTSNNKLKNSNLNFNDSGIKLQTMPTNADFAAHDDSDKVK